MPSSALNSFRPSGQLSCFDFFQILTRRYPNPRINETAVNYETATASNPFFLHACHWAAHAPFLMDNSLIMCHEALPQVRIVTFSPTYTVNALIDVRPFLLQDAL